VSFSASWAAIDEKAQNFLRFSNRGEEDEEETKIIFSSLPSRRGKVKIR